MTPCQKTNGFQWDTFFLVWRLLDTPALPDSRKPDTIENNQFASARFSLNYFYRFFFFFNLKKKKPNCSTTTPFNLSVGKGASEILQNPISNLFYWFSSCVCHPQTHKHAHTNTHKHDHELNHKTQPAKADSIKERHDPTYALEYTHPITGFRLQHNEHLQGLNHSNSQVLRGIEVENSQP